jgi:hypothetical protein
MDFYPFFRIHNLLESRGNRDSALIIVSASETQVGLRIYTDAYEFTRIIRADPPHPRKSAVPLVAEIMINTRNSIPILTSQEIPIIR